LLHLVEIQPMDGSDPVEQVRALERELERFDSRLMSKGRWLVLTKIDQLPEGDRYEACRRIAERLDWRAPWHAVSSVSGEGLEPLLHAIGEALLPG
jgi:GTP-binding protein